MSKIKKYFAYVLINLKKLKQYKADLIFNILSIFIWVSVGVFNIFIIFKNTNSFAGWDFSETALLYGTWSLTFSIYNTFGSGVLEIENYIITGNLDMLLLKPISTLYQVISSRINVMGIAFLIFGSIMVFIFSIKVSITWSFIKILYLIVTIITGGILIFSSYLIIGCIAFWTLKSNAAIRVGYDIHKFAQYPLDIYGKQIKVLLVFIIPYAFSNYYPIAFLLGKSNIFYSIISPIVSIVLFIFALLIWKMGLKNIRRK